MRPTAVLLVNLGTPDSPETPDVRRYLREFLSDPRVVDINALGRWLLLNLIILPFRPAKSGEAYKQVWMKEGSPLLYYGEELVKEVQQVLGGDYVVELGMRYGNPSIHNALNRLLAKDPSRIVVLPLFPQYSSAASGSAVQSVMDSLRERWNTPPVEILDAFYDDPRFIQCFADITKETLDEFQADYVLFSYHGIPERHIAKSEDGTMRCQGAEPCPAMDAANRYCYRAQCYATTRAMAKLLNLEESRHGVSFQSRLGRTPWIRPYTDVVFDDLVKEGKKRVAVVCPSFVADCLETLEEIAIRGLEQWKEAGGEDLRLVPSLNADSRWAKAVADMVKTGVQSHQPASAAS